MGSGASEVSSAKHPGDKPIDRRLDHDALDCLLGQAAVGWQWQPLPWPKGQASGAPLRTATV